MNYRHLIPVGLAVCAGLGSAVSGYAQSRSTDTEVLEEVVVSASRMPTPVKALPNRVTLIDRSALDEQLAISTSTLDALGTRVPSFAPTRQKLTGSGETMRGRERASSLV